MPAEHPEVVNEGVPNAPYFQPATVPPAGTALSDKDWPQNKEVPLLFQPLTVGKTAKLELKNRILVACVPLSRCVASRRPRTRADDPTSTDPCATTRASRTVPTSAASRRTTSCTSASLLSVAPPSPWSRLLPSFRTVDFRLTVSQRDRSCRERSKALGHPAHSHFIPADSGLWNDRQASALKPIFDFIRTQGSIPAIQLGHGGRKTSTLAPWLDTSTIAPPLKSHVATNGRAGGWTDDVMAPSAISYDEETFPHPREMSLKDIDELKEAFRAATARADRAGAQVVELHAAHGYGIHNFLSPVSNKRTDQYGGSLENRMRLPLEILRIMRETLPKEKSLWMRISASDWWPEGEKDDQGEFISWGIEQSKVRSTDFAPLTLIADTDVRRSSSRRLSRLALTSSTSRRPATPLVRRSASVQATRFVECSLRYLGKALTL